MKLYDAAWAPSPRRIRIVLAEKGVEIERETLDMRASEQLGDAYRAVNPRGTVPALALDDGTVLTETGAIARYLEALHPEPPLFGTDSRTQALVEEWTRRVEHDGYAAVVYVFRNGNPKFPGAGETGHWPGVAAIPALAERGRAMWPAFIDALDARLGDAAWLAGEDFSYADVTALCTLDFARAAKLEIPEGAANVRRWHAAAAARPSASA